MTGSPGRRKRAHSVGSPGRGDRVSDHPHTSSRDGSYRASWAGPVGRGSKKMKIIDKPQSELEQISALRSMLSNAESQNGALKQSHAKLQTHSRTLEQQLAEAGRTNEGLRVALGRERLQRQRREEAARAIDQAKDERLGELREELLQLRRASAGHLEGQKQKSSQLQALEAGLEALKRTSAETSAELQRRERLLEETQKQHGEMHNVLTELFVDEVSVDEDGSV